MRRDENCYLNFETSIVIIFTNSVKANISNFVHSVYLWVYYYSHDGQTIFPCTIFITIFPVHSHSVRSDL